MGKLQGVSKTYLNGVADQFSKTISEDGQIETVLNDGVISAIKFSASHVQSEGDRRATEATQSAVSNYEKKYKLKDGAIIKADEGGASNPNSISGGNDDTPEWAKVLIKKNELLEQRLSSFEGDKTKTTRKSLLQKTIESAPDYFKTRIEKDFDRMSFDKDEDFSAWVEEVGTDATKLVEDAKAGGSVFRTPRVSGIGSKKEASDDEAKLVIEKM